MIRTCPNCTGTNTSGVFNGYTHDEDNTRCIDVGCYCRDCRCIWNALEYADGRSEPYNVVREGRDA